MQKVDNKKRVQTTVGLVPRFDSCGCRRYDSNREIQKALLMEFVFFLSKADLLFALNQRRVPTGHAY